MYLLEAVKKASELRPGAASEREVAESVWRTEQIYAERRGEKAAECPYPYDAPLSIEPPYDDAYVFYAAAQTDLQNCDTELYENDAALADASLKAALARFRRDNRPPRSGGFKTV